MVVVFYGISVDGFDEKPVFSGGLRKVTTRNLGNSRLAAI
jgi:hypothetical protein